MNNKFQIFGSVSSEDYDVMVFVDKIPNIEESKILCQKFNKMLYMQFIDNGMKIKALNCNIAVITDGVISDVHKGTKSEVNNSLVVTYDYHKQFHEQQIIRMVDRDIDSKIMRCARFILMYLTRSEHRFIVKNALRSNFIEKIKTLESIDLSMVTDLGDKGIMWDDFLKKVAFQLSQSISLMNGKELYTKEDLSECFPELECMIMRTGEDLISLEKYKNDFIRMCKLRLKTMKSYDEYKE